VIGFGHAVDLEKMVVDVPEVHEMLGLDKAVWVPRERIDRIPLRTDDPPEIEHILFVLKQRLKKIPRRVPEHLFFKNVDLQIIFVKDGKIIIHEAVQDRVGKNIGASGHDRG
jgi:hypothetical protein